MSLHQHDPNRRPDSDYIAGDPAYLVVGNRCRLLDGRRTPGHIAAVDYDAAMFTFFIEQFEDKGKTWDLYAKDVASFQFEPDSKRLDDASLTQLLDKMAYYRTPLVIPTDENHLTTTTKRIAALQEEAMRVLEGQSLPVDPASLEASDCLPYQTTLMDWMTRSGFAELERRVAAQMVLNPNAGELGRQVGVALAQLGLVPFEGTILRRPTVPEEAMREYLMHRLAFVRCLLPRDLTVYRGMSSEGPFRSIPRSLMSWTDKLSVAQAFAEFEDPRFVSVYLIQHKAPRDTILMTHVETQAFHGAYAEREVVLMVPQPMTW
jgi:hypothetical protein